MLARKRNAPLILVNEPQSFVDEPQSFVNEFLNSINEPLILWMSECYCEGSDVYKGGSWAQPANLDITAVSMQIEHINLAPFPIICNTLFW